MGRSHPESRETRRSANCKVTAKTTNIALPEELAAFARNDMTAGGFGNFGDYVRDLLRRRRQQRIEEDLAVVRDATKDAPVGEPPEVIVRELTRPRRTSRRRA